MLISPTERARLGRARDLLAATPDEVEHPLSIRAIAAAVELSPFHFIRRFEALFGDTPHQWRTRERLQRARGLLARGMPVTEVCLEVGFSSLGSFSALFARRVGLAPSDYARRFRALVQVPDALARALTPGCYGLLAALPAAAFRAG